MRGLPGRPGAWALLSLGLPGPQCSFYRCVHTPLNRGRRKACWEGQPQRAEVRTGRVAFLLRGCSPPLRGWASGAPSVGVGAVPHPASQNHGGAGCREPTLGPEVALYSRLHFFSSSGEAQAEALSDPIYTLPYQAGEPRRGETRSLLGHGLTPMPRLIAGWPRVPPFLNSLAT